MDFIYHRNRFRYYFERLTDSQENKHMKERHLMSKENGFSRKGNELIEGLEA